MNFIPCLTWIKKGDAKEIPEKVRLSKEELKKLVQESITDLQDLKFGNDDDEDDNEKSDDAEDLNDAAVMEDDIENDEDVFTKYKLDSYDEELDAPIFSVGQFAEFPTDDKTPIEKEEESDDEDDFRIRPSDNLIVLGHVADDCSTMEVYVYNEEDDDLYVHHDIILPAFPLCMEWLSFDPNEEKPGNYLAIGDMTSIIKIWDLDMVDILEPAASLGKKQKRKEKKKAEKLSGEHGHADAVLDLSWNKHVSHVLASGSADHTIILWDLTTTTPVTHLRHHTEKIQCVKWHPFESDLLLTGACDSRVTLYDCRSIEEKKAWNVNGEVERVLWNHFFPFYFLVGTDQGTVYYFDVRQNEPVFVVDAHNKAISDLSLSSSCPGCLVTSANDTSIKIWDIRNNQPDLLDTKKMKLGNIFSCRISPDSPFSVALGGDKADNNFKVFNLLKSEAVRDRFAPKEESLPSTIPYSETLNLEGAVASSSQQTVPMQRVFQSQKKVLKKKSLSKKKRK